jgi:hypothetical protein
MPKFIINLKKPILYNDIQIFVNHILLKSTTSTYFKKLTKSITNKRCFCCIDKCDIELSSDKSEYKSIESLYSKDPISCQEEWSIEEINEFSTIINSYFTDLFVILT